MTRRAFFIADDRIMHIANSCGAALSYQAQQHAVMPGEQVGPLKQDLAETVIVVEAGRIEVMSNGMSGAMTAGHYLRIPPGTWFAYRNDGDAAAQVLCRTAPVQPAREGRRIKLWIAAA